MLIVETEFIDKNYIEVIQFLKQKRVFGIKVITCGNLIHEINKKYNEGDPEITWSLCTKHLYWPEKISDRGNEEDEREHKRVRKTKKIARKDHFPRVYSFYETFALEFSAYLYLNKSYIENISALVMPADDDFLFNFYPKFKDWSHLGEGKC